MTLLLTDLPRELLQRIIVFAGSDTKTLLHCEKTCRTLRNVVKNDDMTWACVPVLKALATTIPAHIFNNCEPLPPTFFKSRREYACVTNAICMSWRENSIRETFLSTSWAPIGWKP